MSSLGIRKNSARDERRYSHSGPRKNPTGITVALNRATEDSFEEKLVQVFSRANRKRPDMPW